MHQEVSGIKYHMKKVCCLIIWMWTIWLYNPGGQPRSRNTATTTNCSHPYPILRLFRSIFKYHILITSYLSISIYISHFPDFIWMKTTRQEFPKKMCVLYVNCTVWNKKDKNWRHNIWTSRPTWNMLNALSVWTKFVLIVSLDCMYISLNTSTNACMNKIQVILHWIIWEG